MTQSTMSSTCAAFCVLFATSSALSVARTNSARPHQRIASALRATEECVPLELDSGDALYAKWGVCVEEQTSFKSGGLRFNVNDDNSYVVDTIQNVVLTRAPGLGVELLEVANNGEGVGIVVVEGTVPGTSAADADLRQGDCIGSVGPPGGPFVNVEARDWDGLVEALGDVEGDQVELVVKRLAKAPVVNVVVKYPNDEEPEETIQLIAGENLRQALLTRRIKLNDPLARRFDSQSTGGDCGADGTCCTCAVAVLDGAELMSPQKTQERQIMKTLNHPRFRLACKARVGKDLELNQQGDLVIRVNPRQHEA